MAETDHRAAPHRGSRARPQRPDDDDGTRSHARTAERSDGPHDDDQPASHTVAHAGARSTLDDDHAIAHAVPLPGKRSADVIAGIADDPQLASRHGGARPNTRRPTDRNTAAAHLEAHARAHVALDYQVSAAHARAHIVEPFVRAVYDQPVLRSSRNVDGEQIAENTRPIALSQGLARNRRRAKSGEALRDE